MPLRKLCALLALAVAFVSWDRAWSHGSSLAQPTSRDSRIVAVADVHGDIDAFRGILKAAGLINEAGRWAGGKATLVQTGDILDRGAHVRAVLDLLMTLEREAKAAGGRVEALFGNHEGMNLLGEMRDVSPAAFAAFGDARSEQRQADAYEEYARIAAARTKALGNPVPPYDKDRTTWMAAHPRGYLEYREALGPGGRYGRWLRSRNAVLQIGDTIFLHGGISPEAATRSVRDLNDRVRGEIRTFDESVKTLAAADLVRPSFTLQEILQVVALEANALKGVQELTETQARILPALRGLIPINESWLLDSNGPLWFRGYANWAPDEGAAMIAPVLKEYGARRIVVGHTPMAGGRITPRFDNRVFLIDTGMLSTHYKGGRASALEIEGDRVTAIYADERVTLSTLITKTTEHTANRNRSRARRGRRAQQDH